MLMIHILQTLFNMIRKWIRKYKIPIFIGLLTLSFLIITHDKTRKIIKARSRMALNANERYDTVARHGDLHCTKWAVTLSEESTPSEGIRRFLYDDSWCLVVVRTAEDPNYKIMSSIGSNLFVLDETEQGQMNSEFVDGLAKTHESRRNAGYLFALAHGAKMIFDFDARSELKFWMPNVLPKTEFAALNHFENPMVSDFVSLDVKSSKCPIYDPYDPKMNPFVKKVFGLHLNSKCHHTDFTTQSGSNPKGVILGILHTRVDSTESLQDNKKTGSILPKGIYYPFGREASLYYPSSFWSLFVPSGVRNRDGEVLRSLVAKHVCDMFNIKMGFTAKALSWIRKKNVKHIEEATLSFDLQKLIHDMSKFNDLEKKTSYAPQLILDLWNHLYREGYISVDDLFSIQSWIQSLIRLNVQFPGQTSGNESTTLKIKDFNGRVGKPLSVAIDPNPKCEVKKSKSFWTSDLHDGSRADFPLVLSELNQTVWVDGIKNKNNRFGIFEYPGIRHSGNLSPTVRKIVSHSTPVSLADIQSNLEHYKKHPINVDGFICEFPASMCEIWMPLQKTIFFLPAHRYNIGRCNVPEWQRLNTNLKGLDRKHNFLGGLSRYDVEYLDHYTNLSPSLFPSYSGVYLKKLTYAPKVNRFVFIGLSPVDLNTPEAKRQNIIRMSPYKVEDLLESKAIVYDAYSVMSYKLTEFYHMGIPLLMPSLSYYGVTGFGRDRTSVSSNYCKDPSLGLSFPADPEASHPFNPNLEKSQDPIAELYWLQYSDFYDWPHVLHYDNMSHLHYLIDHSDFKAISAKMRIEVGIKKEVLYRTWCEAINQM